MKQKYQILLNKQWTDISHWASTLPFHLFILFLSEKRPSDIFAVLKNGLIDPRKKMLLEILVFTLTTYSEHLSICSTFIFNACVYVQLYETMQN